VEERTKLVCPDCQAVHRLKRVIPGKTYRCKRCGANLPKPRAPQPELPPKPPSGIAPSNFPAPSSFNPQRPGNDADLHLRRLAALSDALAERLEQLRETEIGALVGELAVVAGKMMDLSKNLNESLAEHGEMMARQAEIFGGQPREALDPGAVRTLNDQIRRAMDGFEEARSKHESDIRRTVIEAIRGAEDGEGTAGGQTGRILAALDEKLREQREELRTLYSESFSAVDRDNAETRDLIRGLADRLGSIAASIETLPTPSIDQILPERLVEEIGRTVEERVVSPVADAIALQAPRILAGVQDQKLVDVVSRSVREAQRPLIREIMAGGGGVPAWLFASVLLPLLLILGYLFLPGELGFGDRDDRLAKIEGNVATVEDGVLAVERDVSALLDGGVRLGEDDGRRLREIEDAVKNMYENAWAQVENAGGQKKEIEILNQSLAEFNATVKLQAQMLKAYENHLIRLGIPPEAIFTPAPAATATSEQ
jgi:hypothetical protein